MLKVASKVVLGFIVLSLGLAVIAPKQSGSVLQHIQEITNTQYKEMIIPEPESNLKVMKGVLKNHEASKILVLEQRNMVVLRGPITDQSVAKTMTELAEVSKRTNKTKPIYLVIDSPGGSVIAGLDLIDFAEALPQKIHTITLFSASMAFHTVQNLDKRYILRQGTLMSHRAYTRGMGGQFDGELESRYKMIKRKLDYLDYKAAKRMGMAVADYKDMIINEYWVHGFDARRDRAADEMILARCGESLEGTEVAIYNTLFGPVSVKFSKCPLIRAPLGTDTSRILPTHQNYIQRVFQEAFNNKERFVERYIVNDKYREIFGD